MKKITKGRITVELLVTMFFMHFLTDYYIQSKANQNIKDKKWWKKRHPNNKRKVLISYIFGLIVHSFVWSFSVIFPFYYKTGIMPYGLIAVNILLHVIIDDCKTNKKCISSITDQVLHSVQIILTFLLLCFIYWKIKHNNFYVLWIGG